MEMYNLSLPAVNRFATEYLDSTPEIQRFFHYQYQVSDDYRDRLSELKHRTFMRKELIQCIEKYMEPFPSSKEVERSLKKLAEENGVAVIGGQQAGILTGPLYSIHKIISIIVFARQKEAELNVPVVPVFWIAGEDHDFQEVNHIYIEKEGRVQKEVYPEQIREKKMVSDISLNRERCLSWIEEIMATFGETEHTNDLLAFLHDTVEKSSSFVDFFASIVMELFKDDGLLIVDSADPGIRHLEKEIFLAQIEEGTQITKCVKDMQKEIAAKGFKQMIEITDHAANLFYNDPHFKERILLEFDPKKRLYIGKNGAVRLKISELRQIAAEFPEQLSNNVVTRPLTQEMLFPTLAFIAGPGEIAYWAELKKAFESFSLKMPPIVPRLNITLLDRSIETDLQELGLKLEEVLLNGTEKRRQEYVASVKDPELEKLFQHTKESLRSHYQLIENRIDKGLLPLLEKNQNLIVSQIEFMEAKAEAFLETKHEMILNKFKRVENSLRPLGAPQERMLNALQYMNSYGIRFLAGLAKFPYTFDGSHKVIKI
ncbi:bacillithiol biosynthesis cysteine-adding enzyme BshC [Bacillus benzoevorans]|uniref:Putative cysteine ligase BshC n=1 Tax=Bacillus benzoevorans TaxID=1456 RepID=A0A7X0HQG2_9BACI|nr:bacillithiol biosynthesis cysteine-adding enzyme BshC [Bacillus benzoevorans]MBB6443735.1 bacillithiol biosynthesis cysteine-adding enzyme BshC [Bacillus benzoevorans]